MARFKNNLHSNAAIKANSTVTKPKIVIICGPTGIGKTSTAIELAESFKGEIISADSMQIYKFMDIGSAKPTPSEQARIRHHLIDIVEPDQPFDAAQFATLARTLIIKMQQQNILPFVTGGTGLYIKALAHGLFRSRPADKKILDKLGREASLLGSTALHQRLMQCDTVAAGKIHPNDTFRIIRALEVFESTGTRISDYQEQHHFSDAPFRTLKIGLHMDRDRLYDRINRRVELMIQEGLLNEVKRLLEKGYSPQLKSMQSIGYRHMTGYLSGCTSWEETISLLKRDTRRYAKRQLTWFRKDPDILWKEPGETREMIDLIKRFLHQENKGKAL